MGTCYVCGAPVEDEGYCFGCKEYICATHDIGDCYGHHSPECHGEPDIDIDNSPDDY